MAAVRGIMYAQAKISGVIVCGREYMNSLADSSFSEVKFAIESDPFLASFYDCGETYIRTKCGRVSFVFIGLRYNLDSIKSKARILILWIDEAEPVSETAWAKALPTVRQDHSEVWLTWNPESPESATHKRFRIDPPTGAKIVEINWRDNPWFTKRLDYEREEDTGTADTSEVDQTSATGNDSGAAHDTDETTHDDIEGEGGDGQAAHDDDSEEVDYDGKKFRAPKGVKDGLLRQADYTRKTQELAQQRRDFETSRDATLANDKAYNDAKVKLGVLDHNLEQYKSVDWDALQHADPSAYAQHWRNYTLLKEQRADAERGVAQAKQQADHEANSNRNKRIAEVRSQLPKMIPNFTPALEAKIVQFGTANNESVQDVQNAVIRNPALAVILHDAMQWREHQAKDAKAAAAARKAAAQPAAEIGNNKGTNATQRRTTDPSGDKLSTEQWVAQERKRMAKRNGGK
jgi:hypothetical protein